MTRFDRSALRQRLGDLYRRLGAILQSLPAERPTFAGVVYRLRTRCGKPRCRCREGELHAAWCVSYADAGGRRLRALSPAQVRKLRVLADRYRRLRRRRADLNRTFREMIRVLDRLERSLRVRPARALAAAGREGTRDAPLGSL